MQSDLMNSLSKVREDPKLHHRVIVRVELIVS